MAEIPNALIKDLLSTGYFFEDLKKYPKSKEIDLPSYVRNFAVPYLTRITESYEGTGRPDRSKILNLAIKCLSEVDDNELTGFIFGLKKVAASEIDINEKALSQIARTEREELMSCRRKSQSAESLAKLLVNIIRMFKLAEVGVKKDKSEPHDPIGDMIKNNWEPSVIPGM